MNQGDALIMIVLTLSIKETHFILAFLMLILIIRCHNVNPKIDIDLTNFDYKNSIS